MVDSTAVAADQESKESKVNENGAVTTEAEVVSDKKND